MRVFGTIARQRRALLKCCPSLISTLDPNFFNPMLRQNVVRQSVCVKRLMDETAAAQGRHFNICTFIHIAPPQQAEKP